MDYEKKYEEALERAKAGKPMDEVFPELKESEDERIRKMLIEQMERWKKCAEDNNVEQDVKDASAAIVYLEKQKEQKPESCDCSRDEESYTNGIHHVLMNPEAYGLIKQKPAEQLGGTFTSYDMAKTFTEGQNYVIAHPEKFGLCKPAEWSEEDEKMHQALIHDLGVICEKDYPDNVNLKKELDWFKSLRPQPKSIISDTDKSNLRDAPAIIRKSNHPFKENIALIIEKYL